MKKSHKSLLLIVLLAVFFVLGLWFQAHRLLPSVKLQELLVQKIQTLTSGAFRFQGFQVNYFPQPKLVLEHPQLTFSNDPLVIEAKRICFDFNILPLFWGRMEPSAFYVQEGKANMTLPFATFMNPVMLENFNLQMGAFRAKIPIPLHFTSDLAGKPKALLVKGHVIVDSVEKWNWEKMSGHVVAEIKELSLNSVSSKVRYDPKISFLFKGGQIDTSVEVTKKANEPFLELTATGSGKGLSYEMLREKEWMTPPSMDAEWEVAAAWNNDAEQLKFRKVLVKLPFGKVEANGDMKLSTGEIAGMHVAGSDMALEDLLKYWPALEPMLPFHIGFSGPSKWVLSIEGTWDHLSLHLNWALAQSLLTYGQYFNKPKETPFDLNCDFLLQDGATLAGDFSVKFQQMSMKGNLTGFDVKTGNGQLNLITNKFSVTGWEQYVPVLKPYKLEGDLKVLADWKGDLRKPELAEHILHATIEKGACTTADGQGIRNASLSFDYGPLMFEGRQMKFDLGGSPIVLDLKITEVSDKSQAEGKILAKELKPLEAWRSITVLLPSKTTYDSVRNSLEEVFPAGRSIKNFSVGARYSNQKLDVPVLEFEGYHGQVKFTGTVDFHGKEPAYHCEGEARGLNLGDFLSRKQAADKVLEGTLSFQSKLDGTGWGKDAWRKSLRGQGDFKLIQGNFCSFDLRDALAKIEPFSRIKEASPALGNFDLMNFRWQIAEGKFMTGDLLVKQKDYVMDGEGAIGFDGFANFRTEVFLSLPLAAQLLPKMASSFHKETKAHLGPVPILLSGMLSAPEVKPDPAQVESLTTKIRKGKTKQLLFELVTE